MYFDHIDELDSDGTQIKSPSRRFKNWKIKQVKNMEMAKKLMVNLPQALYKKLSNIVDASEKTYRMSAKVLNSDNDKEDTRQKELITLGD